MRYLSRCAITVNYLLFNLNFLIVSEKESKRTLSAAIIAAMRAAGWLRADAYRLKEGFNGELTIDEVIETKTRGADEKNNFRIAGTVGTKKVSMPGAILANARYLPSAKTIEATSVADGVWYREKIEDVLAESQVYNEHVGLDDEDFEFPEKLRIVGAVVDPDPDVDDHPRFPLRSFKHYNAVLRHHRETVGDPLIFMTRDEFKSYIEAEGEERPKSIPPDYKELELLDTIKPGDMSSWQFTLLITDVE